KVEAPVVVPTLDARWGPWLLRTPTHRQQFDGVTPLDAHRIYWKVQQMCRRDRRAHRTRGLGGQGVGPRLPFPPGEDHPDEVGQPLVLLELRPAPGLDGDGER